MKEWRLRIEREGRRETGLYKSKAWEINEGKEPRGLQGGNRLLRQRINLRINKSGGV